MLESSEYDDFLCPILGSVSMAAFAEGMASENCSAEAEEAVSKATLKSAHKALATALAEARAEGRRQGLEEAAKSEIVKLAHAWRKARLVACAEPIGNLKVWTDLGAAETALSQALATNTPETQKPGETG